MSTGAKAGLAIAIIAVIGIIAALLLWFLGKKRREKEAYSRADDEKTTFGAKSKNNYPSSTVVAGAGPAFGMSSAKAPRLSLRPMSRMMPEFFGGAGSRRSGGNLLNTVSESGPSAPAPAPAPVAAAGALRNMPPQQRSQSPLAYHQNQRPMADNPFADPQNPFADPEKSPAPLPKSEPSRAPQLPLGFMPTTNPQPAPSPVERQPVPMNGPTPNPPYPTSSPNPYALGAAAAGAVVASAAAAAAASQAPKKQLSPREQPSEFHSTARDQPPAQAPMTSAPVPAPNPAPSTPASVAPLAVAAAVPSPGPDPTVGNVYRVLMDFVPSMDDELDLKTGQLVRLLHEYDDGWVSLALLRSSLYFTNCC
jgi:hypothetical protein